MTDNDDLSYALLLPGASSAFRFEINNYKRQLQALRMQKEHLEETIKARWSPDEILSAKMHLLTLQKESE